MLFTLIFMHPSPFSHLYNCSDDAYLSVYRHYGELVSNAMNKALKPNGLFIQRTTNSEGISEFLINPPEKLFETVNIPIESYGKLENMVFSDAITNEYFKKTPIPIDPDMKINYGGKLIISQKNRKFILNYHKFQQSARTFRICVFRRKIHEEKHAALR
jgi:hypothetical protein